MFLCLRVTKHGIVVCDIEQTYGVLFVVNSKAALQVLLIPLLVILGFQLASPSPQEIIGATKHNDRVGVDVFLELGGVFLGQFFSFFRINRILFNRVTIVIKHRCFGRGLFRSDKEDFERGLVAYWVSVKNVTSVLAIVLTESPAEGLTHHFRHDPFLGRVLFKVLVDSELEVKGFKLVIGVSLIFSVLLHLSCVVSRNIYFFFHFFATLRLFTTFVGLLIKFTFKSCGSIRLLIR